MTTGTNHCSPLQLSAICLPAANIEKLEVARKVQKNWLWRRLCATYRISTFLHDVPNEWLGDATQFHGIRSNDVLLRAE